MRPGGCPETRRTGRRTRGKDPGTARRKEKDRTAPKERKQKMCTWLK